MSYVLTISKKTFLSDLPVLAIFLQLQQAQHMFFLQHVKINQLSVWTVQKSLVGIPGVCAVATTS